MDIAIGPFLLGMAVGFQLIFAVRSSIRAACRRRDDDEKLRLAKPVGRKDDFRQ